MWTKEQIDTLVNLPKYKRMREIAQLRAEGKMTEKEYYEVYRPALEAKRGIIRDVNEHNVAGKIVRSKKWIESRITYLEEKEQDLKQRLENVKAEIKERQKELKS